MKIFSDELGRISKIRLSKKDTQKIMNPSKQYIMKRNEIFSEINQKIEIKKVSCVFMLN
jgi:hypothetical protein